MILETQLEIRKTSVYLQPGDYAVCMIGKKYITQDMLLIYTFRFLKERPSKDIWNPVHSGYAHICSNHIVQFIDRYIEKETKDEYLAQAATLRWRSDEALLINLDLPSAFIGDYRGYDIHRSRMGRWGLSENKNIFDELNSR